MRRPYADLLVMPRARGLGMPKKGAQRKASSPEEVPEPIASTEPPETAPPPSPSREPATHDEPPASPRKLERLTATAVVKEEYRKLRPLVRSYFAAVDAMDAVSERAEKAMAVLDRPKPPRVVPPPEKKLKVLNTLEAMIDKATNKAHAAHVAMLEQKLMAVCAQLVSRDLQIGRLRRLLRKHRIATGERAK